MAVPAKQESPLVRVGSPWQKPWGGCHLAPIHIGAFTPDLGLRVWNRSPQNVNVLRFVRRKLAGFDPLFWRRCFPLNLHPALIFGKPEMLLSILRFERWAHSSNAQDAPLRARLQGHPAIHLIKGETDSEAFEFDHVAFVMYNPSLTCDLSSSMLSLLLSHHGTIWMRGLPDIFA
jgi:hypothetical protein